MVWKPHQERTFDLYLRHLLNFFIFFLYRWWHLARCRPAGRWQASAASDLWNETEDFSDSPQLSLTGYSCTLSELGTAVSISLFLAQHSSGIWRNSAFLASGYIHWVWAQQESGTYVGGEQASWYSITCSSQRARNIKWRQYASPTVCFVVVFTYLCLYSAAVHVSVGVCLPERGLGARERGSWAWTRPALVLRLSSDGSVWIRGDTLAASALEEASNTRSHQGDRGAAAAAPLRNRRRRSAGGYPNCSLWFFI